MRKNIKLFLLAVCLLLSDALLKAYIHRHIPTIQSSFPIYPYGGIGIFQNWHGIQGSIVHVMNKGAAWGMFATLQNYLLYVRIAIIGGLIAYLFFTPTSTYRKFCLTLITAGALGNVLDYFIYGHVIDMFYFIFWGYSYPVFNLADSAICIGIILMLGNALFSRFKSSRQAA